MGIQTLFPTHLYSAVLPRGSRRMRDRNLISECRVYSRDDRAGQLWSTKNFPGGYTSYASLNKMYLFSPTFDELRKILDRHANRFAKRLDFDLSKHRLVMTDLWINIVPRHVLHALHLHPNSVLSGTYYLRTPRGSSPIKFEDPRLTHFMGSVPRLAHSKKENQRFIYVHPKEGTVLLWESWLRHEVLQNQSASDRISLSFNYSITET